MVHEGYMKWLHNGTYVTTILHFLVILDRPEDRDDE